MNETILTLTDAAQERIQSVREAEKRLDAALRVTVRAEGPAAFRYFLDFVEPGERTDDDETVDTATFPIFIDRESVARLRGATLDFVEEISDSYFKFDNPNKPPLLEDPVAERIQKVIEEKVNPSVASHGGFVTLMDYRDGRVFIRMGGGCQGCGQSTLTLRQGIERTILTEIPEAVEVLDTTDHAGGQNPYYQPS